MASMKSIIVSLEGRLLEVFAKNIKLFVRYRFLLFDLVSRDLKVKYRRSVLGYLWSFFNPLLMMLVITAVFQNIFRFDIPYYPVYYLTGSIIFGYISEATTSSMSSILNAGALIKKVYIPKYIFPFEKSIFAFVNMLFSLLALIVVILVVKMPLHITSLLFFIPLIYAFIFATGVGLILSAFNVFFRDIGHLYSVWITAWMFFTPIFYPVNILSDNIMAIMNWNPAYLFINYFREVVMVGNIPDIKYNLMCFAYSALMLLVGLVVFKFKQDKFILYI